MLDQTAGLGRAVRVDRVLADVNVPYDPFLVHDERGAVREAAFLVQDAVLFGDRPLEIAEERKVYAFLLGEGVVRWIAVHTDPQNLRPRFFELGDISLIRLELLRSTSGEGQNIKRQHHVLFPLKFAQLHLRAGLIRQGEVRRLVSHLELSSHGHAPNCQ